VDGSYVAALFAAGLDKILKKVAEEAEKCCWPPGRERGQIVWETADLWFHSLVALGYHGIPPAAIYEELERRFGARPGRSDTKLPAVRGKRRSRARSR
jgi:phosphoribosyl-ATP pyrophosphohydrolase